MKRNFDEEMTDCNAKMDKYQELNDAYETNLKQTEDLSKRNEYLENKINELTDKVIY